MSANPKPIKIPITKELKVRLLLAMQKGYLDICDFPEFDGSNWGFMRFLTDNTPLINQDEQDTRQRHENTIAKNYTKG
jgi:hypothetical protein